jgi:hypothetical protein
MKSILLVSLLAGSITSVHAQQAPAESTTQQPTTQQPTTQQTSSPPSPAEPSITQQTTSPITAAEPPTNQQPTQPPTPAEPPTTQRTISPSTAAEPTTDQQLTPDNSAIDDYIFIQEMRMWQALEAHDLVTLKALFLPDFIEVEKSILNREQVLSNLNACTLVGFKLYNHHTRVLSGDAVVLAYSGSDEFTCGESHLKGNYNATTTWVLRNGKWVVQIHTEIPVKS